MAVYFESGYTLPVADQPRTHARIAHSGNWFQGVIATPGATATGFSATGPMGLTSFEKWSPWNNLVTAPLDFSDVAWTLTNATLAVRKITENGSAGQHKIAQPITTTTASHIFAVEVKPAGRTEIQLFFANPSSVDHSAFFDLTDGTVGTEVNTLAGTKATALGDGWWRCQIQVSQSTGARSAEVRLSSGSETISYTGDSTSGIEIRKAWVSRNAVAYQMNLQFPQEADYVCIGSHTLGSSGASVTLQYEDSFYQTLMTIAPEDDSPIWFMFEPQTRQKWQISILDAVEPIIGNIKIGKALQLPRPVQLQSHAPWEFQRQTELRTNYSATGEILGRRVQSIRNETEYSINNVPASWVRTNWPSFQRAAEDAPIYVAWRPDGTYPGVSFGECPATPQTSHTGPRDLMSLSFSLTGPGYE